MDDLAPRLASRVQLTSDGHKPYLEAIEGAFGGDIDYAMLVKVYGAAPEGQRRYSPAICTGAHKYRVEGNPDPKHVSTSFVERQNLNIRMGNRRMTRLTNAFSKKAENHAHMMAIYFMHYNFVRIHQTLKITPAMAAGVTPKLWEMSDMVKVLEDWEFIAFGIGNASAVTYDYTGQNYTATGGTADPTDFGDHMIASITLNCSPCSGQYFLNNPAVTSFQVSTGPYTAPASAFSPYLVFDFVTFAGNAITDWHIFSLDAPSSYAPAPGVPFGGQVNLTIDNDPTFYGVGDNYSTFLAVQSASNTVAGTWSDVSATPLPSTWLMLLSGFVGLGFFAYRGTKKNTAALAA